MLTKVCMYSYQGEYIGAHCYVHQDVHYVYTHGVYMYIYDGVCMGLHCIFTKCTNTLQDVHMYSSQGVHMGLHCMFTKLCT